MAGVWHQAGCCCGYCPCWIDQASVSVEITGEADLKALAISEYGGTWEFLSKYIVSEKCYWEWQDPERSGTADGQVYYDPLTTTWLAYIDAVWDFTSETVSCDEETNLLSGTVVFEGNTGFAGLTLTITL